MRPCLSCLVLGLAFCLSLAAPAAAQPPAPAAAQPGVPPLVRFAGTLPGFEGPILATFTLYAEASGGEPLWSETQAVNVDKDGRYAVLLGSALPDGIPLVLFAGGAARWVGVQVDGRPESARVPLASVPYALKAADAETVAGRPLSAFVLTGETTGTGADGLTYVNPKTLTAALGGAFAPTANAGTANYLGRFTNATDLGNSVVYQAGTSIGVNTVAPAASFHVMAPAAPAAYFDVYSNLLGALPAVNRAARGTPSLPAAVQADDILGGLAVRGFGATQFGPGVGQVMFRAAEPFTDTARGTYLQITTTPLGSDLWVERMRIDPAGRVLVGMTAVESGSFVRGRMNLLQPSGDHGFFIRKPTSDSFKAAIHARSAVDVTGVLIKAMVGVADSMDSGGNIAIFGSNASANGVGVRGRADAATGIGVHGSGGLYAGQFTGNVQVTGTLSKGGGAFQIDHPLDPANKYLMHSFVESPDMMNVYNGNIVLDRRGEAWVVMPEWFEALNRDVRYQLTAIGAPGPNLHIAQKMSGNRFKIAGGPAGAEVSWQVTGIRQDAWANENRIPVEKDKAETERGFFLHPEAHGLPETAALPRLRGDTTVRREEKR